LHIKENLFYTVHLVHLAYKGQLILYYTSCTSCI